MTRTRKAKPRKWCHDCGNTGCEWCRSKLLAREALCPDDGLDVQRRERAPEDCDPIRDLGDFFDEEPPPPGSDEAVKLGCVCPRHEGDKEHPAYRVGCKVHKREIDELFTQMGWDRE